MDTTGVIQLISLILLLILSAFFSSAETALTTVNKVRVRTLVEEGNKRAEVLSNVLDQYSKMISAILIGNNIVNITASALATLIAIEVFGNAFVSLATGILTILVLIFGEIVPKNWAMINNEKISLSYAPVISFLMKILTPVIWVIDLLANGMMKLLHIDRNAKETMTEKDLRTYVNVGHEDGAIEIEEKKMIYNLFDFSDALAKDIMIPRIDMTAVEEQATYEEVFETFRESMYTRLPVYQEDKDNILGFINMKDMMFVEDKEQFHVSKILREAFFTYEYKKTADLMIEMRAKGTNVAFVLNEYGATVGMITLEDLLEEIVGEIRDEYDEDEKSLIQQEEERTYLIEASMKLDDINESLGILLQSEDYDSIGGLVIELLEDRLPEDGESVETADGTRFTVVGLEQTRIQKVRMVLPEPICEEPESEEVEADGNTSGDEDI